MLLRPHLIGLCATVAAAFAVTMSCGEVSASRLAAAPSPSSVIETGTHWAGPNDFAQLKWLGYQFAVVSLDRDPDHWREVFDAAERSGIRLIAGLHPYPFRLEHGRWEIELIGREFIEYAHSRSDLVKALYVFNEPYWVDQATGANTPCGALSAQELRDLRIEIHRVWSRALLYYDFGRPSLWAPGGAIQRKNACVGSRYADATDIADYAGVWSYPVDAGRGYQRNSFVQAMRDEVAYVTREMRAEAIILGQAFRCQRCSQATRMPSRDEIRDLNCTMRWIAPQGVSWYPWRQPAYQDSLVRHQEMWDSTGPGACSDDGKGS